MKSPPCRRASGFCVVLLGGDKLESFAVLIQSGEDRVELVPLINGVVVAFDPGFDDLLAHLQIDDGEFGDGCAVLDRQPALEFAVIAGFDILYHNLVGIKFLQEARVIIT